MSHRPEDHIAFLPQPIPDDARRALASCQVMLVIGVGVSYFGGDPEISPGLALLVMEDTLSLARKHIEPSPADVATFDQAQAASRKIWGDRP